MSHYLFSIFLFLLSLPLLQAQGPLALEHLKNKETPNKAKPNSFLKVNATCQSYEIFSPWQKGSTQSRRALGALIGDQRVLVTAQLVANSTYIELELCDTGAKTPAMIEAIDYECNLAILKPKDSKKAEPFFANLSIVPLDPTSRINSQLALWQTGRNGELLPTPMLITKISMRNYPAANANLLVYEAAGLVRSEQNSFTLPVTSQTGLVGMLMYYDNKNQLASLIPAIIIEHFLKDLSDKEYQGIPNLGISFSYTLDEQWRDYLGLAPNEPGVYISTVTKNASAEAAGLLKGDILTAINGNTLNARGDYLDPQFGNITASHLITGTSFVNDEVELQIKRNGKPLTLKAKLKRKALEDYLIRPYYFGSRPEYFIHGGILFMPASDPYIRSLGNHSSGKLEHIASRAAELENEGKKQIVFISKVFPTVATSGYDHLGGQIITQINGQPIVTLKDLPTAFKACKNGIHEIHLDSYPSVIYLDAKLAQQADTELQEGSFQISELSYQQ
jgi:hypothetical protein